MSGFIDNTSNIDAAEIAAEYRTPEQGVSAKSNSNVAWNDYKRMTPRANQSSNIITRLRLYRYSKVRRRLQTVR